MAVVVERYGGSAATETGADDDRCGVSDFLSLNSFYRCFLPFWLVFFFCGICTTAAWTYLSRADRVV